MTAAPAIATAQAKPPHIFWALSEGRAVFELGSFVALRSLLRRLPKGDGHPVLVLPGFMAGDGSTLPMRRLFTDLGYEAHGWGLGRNVRVDNGRIQAMLDLVERIHAKSGRKISIVGWSLGGVFARELARMAPDKVRCVISLGSPISEDMSHTGLARRLFEALNGRVERLEMTESMAGRAAPPPVPCTSILTRTDGVVAWRGSVQEEGPQSENIEVHASHCGLGVNPMVMVAIADRLAQKEGQWHKFRRDGWKAILFPALKLH